MKNKNIKLPLYVSLILTPFIFGSIQVSANDDFTDEIEIIVTSSSTKYTEEKELYNTIMVSSISENTIEVSEDDESSKEVDLLNEELEINDLNNLIVNNSDSQLYIFESDSEDSEKLGILMPNAVGEAEDLREFDSELDRFIAGEAEWLYINSGNIAGYIKNENLLQGEQAVNELNDLYNTKAKVTANGKVYVRREPSTESDTVTILRSGAYVKVNVDLYDKEAEWIPVIVDDEEGYIHADLVTLINSVDYAMKYVRYEETTYSRGARYVTPPIEETPSAVVDFASQFVGNPYVWGGTSLTNGCDCSGFVMKVYEYFGVSLPHSSYSDRTVGRAVAYDEIQPGDIVCYDGHVGIYAGDGMIVNALNKKNGITYTNVNYDTVLAVRRVLE